MQKLSETLIKASEEAAATKEKETEDIPAESKVHYSGCKFSWDMLD